MSAPAYAKVNFNIPANLINIAFNPGLTLGSAQNPFPTFNWPQNGVLPSLTLGLPASGSPALGNINIIGMDFGTLTGGSETHNVDLTAIKDPAGVTSVNFADVLYWAVFNFSTTAGNVLLVGGAGSNPWVAPFNASATAKLTVPPGALIGGVVYPGVALIGSPQLAAQPVNGTSKVLLLDAGANTIPWLLAACGISS